MTCAYDGRRDYYFQELHKIQGIGSQKDHNARDTAGAKLKPRGQTIIYHDVILLEEVLAVTPVFSHKLSNSKLTIIEPVWPVKTRPAFNLPEV